MKFHVNPQWSFNRQNWNWNFHFILNKSFNRKIVDTIHTWTRGHNTLYEIIPLAPFHKWIITSVKNTSPNTGKSWLKLGYRNLSDWNACLRIVMWTPAAPWKNVSMRTEAARRYCWLLDGSWPNPGAVDMRTAMDELSSFTFVENIPDWVSIKLLQNEH